MTAPVTTTRRHPAGRSLTSRHRPPLPLWLKVALVSPLLFLLAVQVGIAVVGDADPGPTHCCWEVTVP